MVFGFVAPCAPIRHVAHNASRCRMTTCSVLQRHCAKSRARRSVFQAADSRSFVRNFSTFRHSHAVISEDISQAADSSPQPPVERRKLYPPAEDSTLNKIFFVQAFVTGAIGFLLAGDFIPNVELDIFWRIMGGWSVWMFVIPALQARKPASPSRDAINWSFVIVPLTNVFVPLIVKSFEAIYITDMTILLSLLAYTNFLKSYADYEPYDS